jgi:hypothetical protein
MTDNKFSVVFDAENLLSAQIRIIANQLDELRATAETASRPVNRIVNSLSKLTNLDYDTAKNGLSAINRQLTKMSEINPDNLERVFGVFRNLKLNAIATQMEKIASASSGVAKAVESVSTPSISQPVISAYQTRPATTGFGVPGMGGRPQMFFAPDTGGRSSVGVGGTPSPVVKNVIQQSNIADTAREFKILDIYEKEINDVREESGDAAVALNVLSEAIETVNQELKQANKEARTFSHNISAMTNKASFMAKKIAQVKRQSLIDEEKSLGIYGKQRFSLINNNVNPSPYSLSSVAYNTGRAGYSPLQSKYQQFLPPQPQNVLYSGSANTGNFGIGNIGNANALNKAPSLFQTLSGGIGTGGATSSPMAKMKIPTALSNFMGLISIFNSMTFALGTVQMAFDDLVVAINQANSVTKQLATIQAVAANQGVNTLDSATERYSRTVREAIKNQMAFGGTINDNLNGMLKFQQISLAEGVDVRQLNQISQLLSLRDPVQGIEGATIALQELFSGDPVSLRRRFELPASDINEIAKASGNASKQIRMLTQVLAEQGITVDVLNARLNTTAKAYDQMAANAEIMSTITGQQLAAVFENTVTTFNKLTALIASGGIADLDVSKENPINAILLTSANFGARIFTQMIGGQTDLQRELLNTNVEQGVLASESTRLTLEYGRAYADVVRAYADGNAELAKQLGLMRAIQAAQNQEQFVVSASPEDIQSQQQNIEQNRKQTATTMLLTAATQAYAEGNLNAASTLATVMQIQGDQSLSAEKIAQQLIDAQLGLNNVTQEGADAIFGLSNKYRDLIQSQIQSLQQSQMQVEIDEYMVNVAKELADGNFNLADVVSQLAVKFKITNDVAMQYLQTLFAINSVAPEVVGDVGVIGGYINAHQSVFRTLEQSAKDFLAKLEESGAKSESVLRESGAKSESIAKDNNEQLLRIEKDAMAKLLAFDEETYRKRVQALQAFYAESVLMQQKRQYEMTANNLDLVEGRNSKLDLEEKRRLLARENIEAYGSLQLNEAIKQANQYAITGSASFAKEYLSIQQDRIGETESLNWKLHDTLVRLEGDPTAQERAKQIHSQAIAELETYYGTRVGLAEAAARDESEADRKQRRAIIEDAISAAMELTDVDENKRRNIIDNLTIAGQSITDLSSRYVDGVDAMRGSLELLAKAMRDVRDSASILTPEQLSAFNNLPSGIGNVTGGQVEVNNTTVTVGGITVNVTTQADPNEIAKIVTDTIQKQLSTRSL